MKITILLLFFISCSRIPYMESHYFTLTEINPIRKESESEIPIYKTRPDYWELVWVDNKGNEFNQRVNDTSGYHLGMAKEYLMPR